MSDPKPRHCTDPAIHGPHTYADDTDMRDCPGSSLSERIAERIGTWCTGAAAEHRVLTDLVMREVDAETARVRAALVAELDDMDPDHTMRDGHTTGTDQGHPGNAWWRTYCEVGGMMRALACIDNVRSTHE